MKKTKKKNDAETGEKESNGTGLGLVYGMMAGVLIGSITGDIGLWIAIGTALAFALALLFLKKTRAEYPRAFAFVTAV